MPRQMIGSVGSGEVEGRVNQFAAFTDRIFKNLGSLVGCDDETAVRIILKVLESLLIDIAKGNGRFNGLNTDERQEAVNQALDEAIETLTGLLGVSARLAVCLSLAEIGNGIRSRREIAA